MRRALKACISIGGTPEKWAAAAAEAAKAAVSAGAGGDAAAAAYKACVANLGSPDEGAA